MNAVRWPPSNPARENLQESSPTTSSLADAYRQVRSLTLQLCDPLQAEDFTVQSMPDASPAKWHLAHTTWFFEQFILRARVPGYRVFHERYDFLFNSYYQSIGPMHQRAARGLLTRPGVDEIRQYRHYVDERVVELLLAAPADAELSRLITLGLNHEQQHQELLLTDVKHLFSCNPLLPAYATAAPQLQSSSLPLEYIGFSGGLHSVGTDETASFCFDNETPQHTVYLQDYALANRLVTNGEYLEFVQNGGYSSATLWLSDGWNLIQSQQWSRPLYWNEDHTGEFTLQGISHLDLSKPVSHLSFYEADAFARWSNARLPREEEWEAAAASVGVSGNLLERGTLHPQTATESGLTQMFGDVWEWTASAYSPYPGYRAQAGALGEYNGKFMVNQLVLRGGSCVTAASHIRAGYRNFFYPQARWQFSGLRLAKGL